MKAYATALWGQFRSGDTLATLDLTNHEMVVWQNQTIGCIATNLLPEALVLSRLYLAPAARNRGIGAQVLEQIISRADDNALPVTLRVLTPNPAIRFYKRHGFTVHRETREHFYMIRPNTPGQTPATKGATP